MPTRSNTSPGIVPRLSAFHESGSECQQDDHQTNNAYYGVTQMRANGRRSVGQESVIGSGPSSTRGRRAPRRMGSFRLTFEVAALHKMLESIAASILTKYLGDYVEGASFAANRSSLLLPLRTNFPSVLSPAHQADSPCCSCHRSGCQQLEIEPQRRRCCPHQFEAQKERARDARTPHHNQEWFVAFQCD